MEAMLQPSKIAHGVERHEELFLARYSRLRVWALQLTKNDFGRAEDLVHDAYVQFTLSRPDLDSIGNLDGYLYSMLRNLHLSEVRRVLRRRERSLSVVDYDSAEIGLRAADPREQIRLQDELRQVCHYACSRKETSKAGSVLILRFLHGYYPKEIARVMNGTREAVEERLRVARSEARQYLLNPESLRFIEEPTALKAQSAPSGFARRDDEFLNELRRIIFDSRRGDCLTGAQLKKLYQTDDDSAVDQITLAHIVSCPECLDEVNRLLGLPLLMERFPTDTLGTDTRSKRGGRGSGGFTGGNSGGATDDELRRLRKRAGDVLEHKPSELCVSVNGYLMAAQKVGSELNEQTLSINVAEKIDFVEIFSEQDIRLLFFCVGELPPQGAYSQHARVELSDRRTLEATLSFSNPWPTLQVVYSDPYVSAVQLNEIEEAGVLLETEQPLTSPREDQSSEKRERPPRLQSAIARLSSRFASPNFWLRPGAITAVVSLILIAALLFIRLHVPVASAAELLRRSTAAEETVVENPQLVLHRTINLEERRASVDGLVARHRIEVWQSTKVGIRLRRIYDEQNSLIAGEWTKRDGASTVYHRGAEPQERTSPDVAAGAVLETGELWRLDPSAREFGMLVGRNDAVEVEERANTYVLSYRNDTAGNAGKLLRATLTLDKNNLRAVEQTLTVERDGEAREYRFIEAGFEQTPAASVAPAIFQPEPELLGRAERIRGGAAGKAQAADDPLHPSSLIPHPSAVASPELEIEVTYLLNRIKANLGEQVSMTRTTGGTLRVEALVETEGRKEEILRALSPVVNNPAVKVEVSTVAEAVKRQKESKPADAKVREVEVQSNKIPADAELRAYFSARLVGNEAIDEEISRYASRVMSHSRQALLQASALKQLVRRFSPQEMRALAPEAQSKGLAMIREHASAYMREVAALRQELRPVFNGGGEAAVETVNEGALASAADRLLQLSYSNDETVRSAFTVSADGRSGAAIKSAQFWRSLAAAEKLAAAIESLYQK
ncbi:MAG: sigma-70 family RNA polymerase sigma factor [Acidobacteriota bacterium]|nr:sigma-70 family RNA polymerase sigma factor [Acidobacteriota bacterium]